MTNKPKFEATLKQAKKELTQEIENDKSTIRTSIAIDKELLCSIKQLAVKRKLEGKKPNTVTGIIRDALSKILKNET